jgi:uncharacterized membrane protein
VTAYSWLKLIHVIAAITAVGTNLTYFVWLARTRLAPDRAAPVLDGIKVLDSRLANPAYVVLPVTGIAMVLVGDLSFSTFWIATAIGLYIVMGVIAGTLFGPALRRQTTIALAEGAASTTYELAARRTVITGVVTMLPVAGILYLMVMKPTLS